MMAIVNLGCGEMGTHYPIDRSGNWYKVFGKNFGNRSKT